MDIRMLDALVDDEPDISPIISIYDTKYNLVRVVDAYKSFIWTDRYNEVGEFELYFSMSVELMEFIKLGYYLIISGSEHAMIIESFEIRSDIDDGDELIVRGRSLESILDRRIIWGEHKFGGNLQMTIDTILTDNFIKPADPDRAIPGVIFKENTDPAVDDLNYEILCDSDNILDVITKICQEKDLGFKITFDESFNMVFQLYKGVNRSYEQIENEYVIFSPDFENLIGANFLVDRKEYKNVTLVIGTGNDDKEELRVVGKVKGLERREIFTDARDIAIVDNPKFEEQLKTRGQETLSDQKESKAYEGEIEALHTFVYGKDFFIGDIVQIEDAYGNIGTVYVSEIVISFNESGYSIYPTFKSTEETEV